MGWLPGRLVHWLVRSAGWLVSSQSIRFFGEGKGRWKGPSPLLLGRPDTYANLFVGWLTGSSNKFIQ